MAHRFFNAVIIAFIAGSLVTADALASRTWEAGVKLGGQGAKLKGDLIGLYLSYPPQIDVRGPVSDKTTGFVGGGFIRRNFTDMFGVQMEALYSQKGGEGGVVGTVQYLAENNQTYVGEVDGRLTASLDYIEVPVLAIFSFPADDKFTLVAELGVSFAFSSSAEIQLKGEASFDQPNYSKIIKNFDQTAKIGGNVNDFDFGGVVGGGLEIAAGDAILYFDARLTFGLVSVDETGDKDVKNEVVSIFAGVGIPFGGEM